MDLGRIVGTRRRCLVSVGAVRRSRKWKREQKRTWKRAEENLEERAEENLEERAYFAGGTATRSNPKNINTKRGGAVAPRSTRWAGRTSRKARGGGSLVVVVGGVPIGVC
jgi:hypothetical protein